MADDRGIYIELTLADQTDEKGNHFKIQIRRDRIYGFSESGTGGAFILNEEGDSILVLDSYDDVAKKLNQG